MANKRTFKKDLQKVFSILIEECIFTYEINKDKEDEIQAIIDEAADVFTTTLQAKNTNSSVSSKQFYNKLQQDFIQSYSELFEKLKNV